MNNNLKLSIKLGLISWGILIIDIIIAISPLKKITNPILTSIFLIIIMSTVFTCLFSSIGIVFSLRYVAETKVFNKKFVISFLINFLYLLIFIIFGIIYYNAVIGI